MKTKNLQYYLRLKYDVIVREVEDGGYVDYKAFTKELNPDAFHGIGSTPDEAIRSLNEVKEELFPHYLENGLEIPEPEPVDEVLPSGKFVVRTSPSTHLRLLKLAKKNKQSLNACINSIFDQYTTWENMLELAKKELENAFNQYTQAPPFLYSGHEHVPPNTDWESKEKGRSAAA